MLNNIDQEVYTNFKQCSPVGDYRLKAYEKNPVPTISEIVRLGYLDVCRTLHYIDCAQSQMFKDSVICFINKLLDSPPENQEDFDSLHHECCQKCLGAQGKAQIHYGQDQKILNMSLKYLYNEYTYAFYRGKTKQFQFPDDNVEHFFHLPIDNQILESLIYKYKFIAPKLPWSKWEYKHYICFQHQLRQCLNPKYSPLEIDYMLWNAKDASLDDAISSSRPTLKCCVP